MQCLAAAVFDHHVAVGIDETVGDGGGESRIHGAVAHRDGVALLAGHHVEIAQQAGCQPAGDVATLAAAGKALLSLGVVRQTQIPHHPQGGGVTGDDGRLGAQIVLLHHGAEGAELHRITAAIDGDHRLAHVALGQQQGHGQHQHQHGERDQQQQAAAGQQDAKKLGNGHHARS